MINKRPIVIIFCFLSLSLFNFSSSIQAAINDNLCAQIQCVKIQNGYLHVLSSDNVTYQPYFIKAVGYEPIPIGRHPADWGYDTTDPRSSINNIYDDPALLNRDFALLQQMHANTIRIWSGSDITSSSGEYPNKLTMNTLDIAQQYNLKVIPGFWVNALTFDVNNNIGSTDTNGNPLTGQQIINNFVAYVNNFKGSPSILFWAIGNENNYQQINGQGLTSQQLTAWYSLVNAMAQASHNAEGVNFHPVAIVNGEIAEIGNAMDGATDAQLSNLDIWGANIYRGQSFGSLFSDYSAKSRKPLWISEYGVDAFSTTRTPSILAAINDWQSQMMDPEIISQEGSVDPTTQSSWDGALWNEIFTHSPLTIGGSVMAYSDEWWKPNEWMCTIPNPNNDPIIQSENAQSVAYCDSTHSNFGFTFFGFPDDYSNEQWWGVMSISKNPLAGGADIMTTRPIYSNLQAKWQSNPWVQVTLYINGSGAGNFNSSLTPLGDGLNCNFSAGSSTGVCTALFVPHQLVTLSFSSTNGSTITNWGVDACSTSNSMCNITPDTDISINMTVTVLTPPSLAVSITRPTNPSYAVAGSNITITANASETNGTISRVAFYNGSTLLGTATGSPYTFTWTNVAAGYYSLTAVATDGIGATRTSLPVSLAVANTSPQVFITSPANQSTVATNSIIISAIAEENYGGSISRVAFYDGTNLLGTVTSGPYVFSYTWTNVPAGLHHLTAVATDGVGTSSTSSMVSVTVATTPASLAVAITVPSNPSYAVAGSNVTITANASETNGTINRVAFYNGGALLGTATSSPYTYLWPHVPAGSYSLTALATDSNGATRSSAPVSITLAAASPQVFITSPANLSTVTTNSITISAIAEENYGGSISRVAFYDGANLLGTATNGPYVFSYTWTNMPAGLHNLTAVATDGLGTSSTSSTISFTVATTPASLAVAITVPSNPSYAVAGSNVTITANASETNGTINRVAFYNGGTLLGTATSSPYTYTWPHVAAGSYSLTAIATDNNGATRSSGPVSITLAAASPQVFITSPANLSTVTTNSITISAIAEENYGGSISRVAFYDGGNLLGTITSGPYVFKYTWTNIPVGLHNLTAIATDAIGTTASSSVISITVGHF